ncbi:PEP-CTERM sorting domain-containing protein [Cerasicoccus frondis]|uniref:PEP-CTERM sorting domain-containing protein n=1 Tax=Cerasicoccus frondis TaxID=490090 RepID=UPI002852615F|nr:PEP-CTERM sorting domain-containing protein [Cerasicoccus frondis]
MFRTATIAFLTFAASLSAQVISNWSGGGDGPDFSDPLNWDNMIVPGSLDTAFFGSAADGYTITYENGPIDVASLYLATPALDGGPFINGDLDITVSDYLYINSGGITSDSGSAAINIMNTGELEITGTADISFIGRAIYMDDETEMNFSGTNTVYFQNTTVDNYGDMYLDNPVNLHNDGNSTIYNYGLLVRATNEGEAVIGVDVYSGGQVAAVDGADLTFTGNYVQSEGDLILEAGSTITFSGSASIGYGGVAGEGIIRNNTGEVLSLTGIGIDPLSNAEAVFTLDAMPEPGKLIFEGNVAFDQNSAFYLDLHGPNSGEYDQIEFVSGFGDFTEGPDIILFGYDNFSSSDVLTIFEGTYTGQFSYFGDYYADGALLPLYDSLTYDYLGDFELNYLASSITLSNFTPVPEPQTWALMGLGGALIGLWVRRRLARG